MKKLLIPLLWLMAVVAMAAFPTLTKTYIVDADDVDGTYRSFYMSYPDGSDLAAMWSFSDSATTSGVSFTGVAVKVVIWQDTSYTNTITYLSTTNVTVSGSNVTYTISGTNQFPISELFVELYATNSTTRRTMAQGKMNVIRTMGP